MTKEDRDRAQARLDKSTRQPRRAVRQVRPRCGLEGRARQYGEAERRAAGPRSGSTSGARQGKEGRGQSKPSEKVLRRHWVIGWQASKAADGGLRPSHLSQDLVKPRSGQAKI